jgi:hypothetical protein
MDNEYGRRVLADLKSRLDPSRIFVEGDELETYARAYHAKQIQRLVSMMESADQARKK